MASYITESGMNFIADNVFYIEKSKQYTDLGEGVRSVEFVRVKDDRLLFVEAKTTFPNPGNPSVENVEKFRLEVDEICDKFIHSLNLFASIKIGITEERFNNDFTMPNRVTLALILIIKNHELKWCRPIKRKFLDALPSYFKAIWKPMVYVINQEIAAECGLITVNN